MVVVMVEVVLVITTMMTMLSVVVVVVDDDDDDSSGVTAQNTVFHVSSRVYRTIHRDVLKYLVIDSSCKTCKMLLFLTYLPAPYSFHCK